MSRVIFITDPSDPRIEPYRKIRERDLVGREGLFIAEGTVVLDVMMRAGCHRPVSVLLAERRVSGLAGRIDGLPPDVPVYAACDEVIAGIAGFPMHRGVLALGRRASMPQPDAALSALGERARVLVLIGIANHDNMGGIFRNAAAFGVDLVLLDGTSCDPLYRKAIRVSVGGALIVPFARVHPDTDVIGLLSRHDLQPLALTPAGDTPLHELAPPRRAALLLGAEGPGLPPSILERARGIRIPMASGFDSLNVATACGIALHHLLTPK